MVTRINFPVFVLFSVISLSDSVKLATSVDDIQVYSNSKYLKSKMNLTYIGPYHHQYMVNIEHIFFRDVRNVYVSLFFLELLNIIKSIDFQCNMKLEFRYKNESEYKTVFDNFFNVCKFLSKKNGAAFIIKFIVKLMKEKQGVFVNCPKIKKVHETQKNHII